MARVRSAFAVMPRTQCSVSPWTAFSIVVMDVKSASQPLFNASYCGKEMCLTFSHVSHGAAIGIETDKPNSGLNFLLLEYRFR